MQNDILTVEITVTQCNKKRTNTQSKHTFTLRYPSFNYIEILHFITIIIALYNKYTFTVIPITQMYKVINITGHRGGTVAKVLRYKSGGRWFDPSWCHWSFSLT